MARRLVGAVPGGRRVIGRRRETIADAAHRFDVGPGAPQLLTQPFDVGVDGAGGDLAAHPPDVVEQRGARLHAPAALEQRRQQAQLEGGQRHLVAVDPDPVGVAIDAQLAEHQHAAPLLAGAGVVRRRTASTRSRSSRRL